MELLFVLLALLCARVSCVPSKNVAKKPNFLFILTDDQDHQMDSMKYMAGVRTHLTEQGAYFNHHFCTVALCCPSRVNMWTGKAAHNTNVTDLQPPYGQSLGSFKVNAKVTRWLSQVHPRRLLC